MSDTKHPPVALIPPPVAPSHRARLCVLGRKIGFVQRQSPDFLTFERIDA